MPRSAFVLKTVLKTITGIFACSALVACTTPQRPPVRAVPTDTLKVNPELVKPAPAKDQSK